MSAKDDALLSTIKDQIDYIRSERRAGAETGWVIARIAGLRLDVLEAIRDGEFEDPDTIRDAASLVTEKI